MTNTVWRPTQEDYELWRSLNPYEDYLSFWSMFTAEDYAALEADASDAPSSQPETSEPVDPEPDTSSAQTSSSELTFTLDEVLDILDVVGASSDETDEQEEVEVLAADEEAEESAPVLSEEDGSTDYTGSLEVVGLDGVVELLETIQAQTEQHPLLTTSFEDYTVTEGLLLLALLLSVLSVCVRMLKGGFSWLLW